MPEPRDGATYWVRKGEAWGKAEHHRDDTGSFWCLFGAAFTLAADHWDEIGPAIPDEPPESFLRRYRSPIEPGMVFRYLGDKLCFGRLSPNAMVYDLRDSQGSRHVCWIHADASSLARAVTGIDAEEAFRREVGRGGSVEGLARSEAALAMLRCEDGKGEG